MNKPVNLPETFGELAEARAVIDITMFAAAAGLNEETMENLGAQILENPRLTPYERFEITGSLSQIAFKLHEAATGSEIAKPEITESAPVATDDDTSRHPAPAYLDEGVFANLLDQLGNSQEESQASLDAEVVDTTETPSDDQELSFYPHDRTPIEMRNFLSGAMPEEYTDTVHTMGPKRAASITAMLLDIYMKSPDISSKHEVRERRSQVISEHVGLYGTVQTVSMLAHRKARSVTTVAKDIDCVQEALERAVDMDLADKLFEVSGKKTFVPFEELSELDITE